jgi:hypothetical protein
MKLFRRRRGVVKGAPSGFMVSLLVHGAAFLLAGMFVVFTVTQKEEKKFIPPAPKNRPKMKLKKPKVKVKKTSKPKPTTRIVTKVKRASMPDIQLPEMSGMTDGIGWGLGGFEIMPDLNQVTLFGGGQTIGNDFVGTFYDFKRDRSGRPVPMSPDTYLNALKDFVHKGFRPSAIARYYRSPKKLYATTFVIPPILSTVAPIAFDEADTLGYAWMAHYKGQLVYPEDIRFRFWGMGDDIMIIRVDGKVILNACWPGNSESIASFWSSNAKNNRRFYLGNNTAVGGDWIELKAGEALDMEVMIGETPGGQFASMLTVEVDGESYERNRQGGPILPIFKTTEPSLDLLDAIYHDMVPGEASLTNGPVFRDYISKGRASEFDARVESPDDDPVQNVEPESRYRIWSTTDGKGVEAELVSVMGGNVVLKTIKGKQFKLPVSKLTDGDREYTELESPPEFNITFTKSSAQRILEMSPFNNRAPPQILDYTFGVKLNQKSARVYNHELKVEFFAIAEEISGDRYILVDHQEKQFVPTKENKRSCSFSGHTVEFMKFDLDGQMRGKKYSGYLVMLTDKRGKIIQYSASSPWLWEHIENLRNIPVGRYMDKTCTRVHPTSPKGNRY